MKIESPKLCQHVMRTYCLIIFIIVIFIPIGCSVGGQGVYIGHVYFNLEAPRIPSAPHPKVDGKGDFGLNLEALRIPNEPNSNVDYNGETYAVVWSVLGTVKEQGYDYIPIKIILKGKEFDILNVETVNRAHLLFYRFRMKDKKFIHLLPVDVATGNLLAVSKPIDREKASVKIVFGKQGKNDDTFIGFGQIIPATLLEMDSSRRRVTGGD